MHERVKYEARMARTSRPCPRRGALPSLALLFFALASVGALPSAAQSSSAAPGPARIYALPAPDPRLAALGSASEPLPAPLLVRAALLVSGVPEAQLEGRTAALEAILAPAREAALRETDQAARAEKLLEYLHDKGPFRAYASTATSLTDILDRGLFNCVSSALLYLVATRELGIPCSGIRTPDHAFCRVQVEGRSIDVETTTAYGFDPGTKREFTDAFGKVTGYSYVPPGDYARREAIDDRRLLSLVLSNRAALLEAAGRWSEALALAVSYEAMEPGAEGRDFALGRVNNLAVSLLRSRDWEGARALAAAAKERWGADPRIAEIAAAAADGALVEATGAGGGTPRLGFRPSLALVDQALAAGDIETKRAVEFYVYLYGTEANRLGRGGDWLGAAALAEAGLAKTGNSPSLVQAAANYRRNFVVSVHNRFAALFNAGRYAEAANAAVEGLSKLPGDPTLQADLNAARRAGG